MGKPGSLSIRSNRKHIVAWHDLHQRALPSFDRRFKERKLTALDGASCSYRKRDDAWRQNGRKSMKLKKIAMGGIAIAAVAALLTESTLTASAAETPAVPNTGVVAETSTMPDTDADAVNPEEEVSTQVDRRWQETLASRACEVWLTLRWPTNGIRRNYQISARGFWWIGGEDRGNGYNAWAVIGRTGPIIDEPARHRLVSTSLRIEVRVTNTTDIEVWDGNVHIATLFGATNLRDTTPLPRGDMCKMKKRRT